MEIIPLISFFAGVVSVLSPCILPVIPIFVAVSLNSKSKTEVLSFTLGLLSVFVIVVILTGFFTSLVYGYMFYVRLVSAVLLFIIGILMFADYSIGFKAISFKNGGGGSFALGFLTSLSWAPCYGAYLISLIALLVSSENGLYAVFNLFLYVFGFSLTLFGLSYLISKIDLEKLVLKTRYIPKIFAVLVIFSAIYLFWESFKVLV